MNKKQKLLNNISFSHRLELRPTRSTVISNVIFFTALLLNLVNMKLFEKTIIRLEIIAVLYVFGGCSFFLFKKKLKELSSWNNFTAAIFCLFVSGSYLTTFMLGINYCFAEKKTENRIYKIVRKTEIIGPKYDRKRKKPAAIIETGKNQTKRMEFKRDMKARLDQAEFLELETSKGFFYFEVIRGSKLI